MASALLHMNCPQLKNDIIVMESNSYNESLQGLGRVKRDHDLDELDRCQVKKRRKQSKPSRITSTELFPDNEIKSSIWVTLPHQNHETNLKLKKQEHLQNHESIYCENSQENKKEIENDKKHFDSEVFGNSEDMCPGLYTSQIKDGSPFPLNLSHKTPSPQGSADSMSSNLDERGWYKTSDNASLLCNMHNSESVNQKNQSFQNSVFQSSQACSIILPNFKRIMVGNSDTQITSPHRIFNPEAFCDLCNKEFCNKYFLKTHKANKHGIYMENIGPNSMENLSTVPLMNFFSTSISNLTLSNNQACKKPTTNFNNNTNKTNSSMRAFCNICQREFCNKYFVRRHKAKIHGIVESNGDFEYKPLLPNDKGDGLVETNLPGPSSCKGNKDLHAGKEAYEQKTEEEKNYVKKEDDSEDTNSPHDALSLLVSTWQNEESKERSKSPERQKKVSILNSAFCDICCKEYCNKYFLRIHKQKCHGIIYSEKEEKLKDMNSTFCKTSQPMPLNLTLKEINRDQNEIININNCNSCKINFTDSCSLKSHYEQVHKNNTTDISSESNLKPQELQDHPQIEQSSEISLQKETIEHVPSANSFQENVITVGEKQNLKVDLKKVNTVLFKLSQQTNLDNSLCDLCNQDYGNLSSLENHIIRDHSTLIEEINNSFIDGSNSQISNKLECSKYQLNFSSITSLDQHLSEKHISSEPKLNIKISPDSQDTTSQTTLTNERPMAHTPTSSFCEICKKELCNKYFMKTHMQRMHGISIENGAHIGGVVCDICNKELCSKYFLRVHKQNSHGIVEETFLPQIGSEIKTSVSSNIDVTLRPNENELNIKYFTHFTEICTICSRRFRSTKWLKAHLLNDHGDEGKDKWRESQTHNGNKSMERSAPDATRKYESYYSHFLKNFMNENISVDNGPSTSESNNEIIPSFLNRNPSKQYQCSYCPFLTPALALLLVHERSHVPQITENQDFRCPVCSLLCESNDALDKHLFSQHQTNFPFKKNYEDALQFIDNSQIFQFDEMENKKSGPRDDNNYDEIKDYDEVKARSPLSGVCLKCNKCSYVAHHVEMYSEHIKNEHKLEPQAEHLQIIRDALLHIANNSHIPASFAVPNNLGNFMMQPFVLEDKAYGANTCNTFLSSLVFLPVKERLNKPITASFKLTPT